MKKIPQAEQAKLAEYMAKYPELNGTDLAEIVHANGDLTNCTKGALRQRVNETRRAQRRAIMEKELARTPEPAAPEPPADGEQIAIVGTITREEYDSLTRDARKWAHITRVIFASAGESEYFPGSLQINHKIVDEALRSLEPEQYAATLERIRRNNK